MSSYPIGICNDRSHAIPRQSDAEVFRIHFTGGIRGSKIKEDHWMIDPIFEDGEARIKGYLSRDRLFELRDSEGLSILGFQSSSWSSGELNSSWRPLVLGEKNSRTSPADVWSNISLNIFMSSRADRIKEKSAIDYKTLSEILDDHTVEERLARSISLSLRSMDISVEKIAQHYNEQLVNRMYSGTLDNRRTGNMMDQTLFAHVHAFFLQLGSARDYLAAFIAKQIGMNADHGKVDSMNNLRNRLRAEHMGKNRILDLLFERKLLAPDKEDKDRWVTAGWLKEMTDLRNEFVHRRPYGLIQEEKFGWVVPLKSHLGLYRYYRPIRVEGKPEVDLLDTICLHYHTCVELFFQAAIISGLDGSMMILEDKDVSEVRIHKQPE